MIYYIYQIDFSEKTDFLNIFAKKHYSRISQYYDTQLYASKSY